MNWEDCGVGDAEVLELAAGLAGNTACQTLQLGWNMGVTDASMRRLKVAVENSGVMGVILSESSVSVLELRAMAQICAHNTEVRLRVHEVGVTEVLWSDGAVEDAEVVQLSRGLGE